MEENEIWKDIEYYNGIYKISSLGNVIRFKANRWVRVKSWKNTNGYNQVSLSRNGAREVRLVHRLVANAFIPNPNNYSCINYNPQIQISAESETKRSIFREKDKTKRSKKESAQHSKSRNKSFVMTSVSAL